MLLLLSALNSPSGTKFLSINADTNLCVKRPVAPLSLKNKFCYMLSIIRKKVEVRYFLPFFIIPIRSLLWLPCDFDLHFEFVLCAVFLWRNSCSVWTGPSLQRRRSINSFKTYFVLVHCGQVEQRLRQPNPNSLNSVAKSVCTCLFCFVSCSTSRIVFGNVLIWSVSKLRICSKFSLPYFKFFCSSFVSFSSL